MENTLNHVKEVEVIYNKFINSIEERGHYMIKLIATDMDGTFLDDHNQFPEDFYEVFYKLKKKGIIFGAASGRQYYNLVERFHDIKEQMLFIAENGTYVVYKGEELYSHTLNLEEARKFIKIARTIEGVHIVLCGKKAAYIERSEPEALAEVNKYYARCDLVEDLMLVEDEILKVSLLDFKGAEQNSATFFTSFKKDYQVTIGGYFWMDIMNAGANKGIAIKRVQELLNIHHNETMVFGDYLNDLEMMQSAYYSFAMGNAHDQIKDIARFETKTNNQSGVIETIKEHILIA